MDGSTMKRIHVWFAMFAVIVFLCAPCASAMQTVETTRTIRIKPSQNGGGMYLNIMNASNQQYSNYNVSVKPFMDNSTNTGVILSSPEVVNIMQLTSVSDDKDNTDFRIATYHKFHSFNVMGGFSTSWWRVPYYYNISSLGEQFDLTLKIWKITYPANCSFMLDGMNELIPNIQYQPSFVWEKTFTDIGYHNDSYSWFTKTNISLPNQINESIDGTIDYKNVNYQFCWVNITAPFYTDVTYVATWHINHPATMITDPVTGNVTYSGKNANGETCAWYVTSSDMGGDLFYRTQLFRNGIYETEVLLDADIPIVATVGMSSSTTGYKLPGTDRVTANMDINTEFTTHTNLAPGTALYYDEFTSIAPGWTSAIQGFASVTQITSQEIRCSAGNGLVGVAGASFSRTSNDWNLHNNTYTMYVQYTVRNIGNGFTYVRYGTIGNYAMWININPTTITGYDSAIVPITAHLSIPLTHVIGHVYQYIFRMDNSHIISIFRNVDTPNWLPHQTFMDYVGYLDTYDNVYGRTHFIPAIFQDGTTFGVYKPVGSTAIIASDFAYVIITSSAILNGQEVYGWGTGTIPPYTLSGNWERHTTIEADGLVSRAQNYHMQLDTYPIGLQSSTFQIIDATSISPVPVVGDYIWWSIYTKRNNPNPAGTWWQNVSKFVELTVLGYVGGTWYQLGHSWIDPTSTWQQTDVYGRVDIAYTRYAVGIVVVPLNAGFYGNLSLQSLKIGFDSSTILFSSQINKVSFYTKVDISQRNSSNWLTVLLPFKYVTPPIYPPQVKLEIMRADGFILQTFYTNGNEFFGDFILISLQSNQLDGGMSYMRTTIISLSELYMFLYDYNNKFQMISENYYNGLTGTDGVPWNQMYIYSDSSSIPDTSYGFTPINTNHFTWGKLINTIDEITTPPLYFVVVKFYEGSALLGDTLLGVGIIETSDLTALRIKLSRYGYTIYNETEWNAYLASRHNLFLNTLFDIAKWWANAFISALDWIGGLIVGFAEWVVSFVIPLIEDIYYAIVNLCAFFLAVLGFVMVTFIMLNFVNIWLLLPTQPIDVTIQHIHSSAKSYMGMAKSMLSGASGVANIMSSKMFKGKQGGGSE
jgi:hypothetical protein